MTELLVDAPAEESLASRVQLYACGFGAGAPHVFGGSLLLPAGVRLSDYCNLDEPTLVLQAAHEGGSRTRFALAKEAVDAVWTFQRQRSARPQLIVAPLAVEVHVQTRLLDIVGTMHLAPGADPLEMLIGGTRRFAVLSGARVLVPGGAPRLDTGAGVCLVNRAGVVAAEARAIAAPAG